MKKVVFVFMLIFNSVLFSQNNLGQILFDSGFNRYRNINDTCDCKSKIRIDYNYRIFGKRKYSYKYHYKNGKLFSNNVLEINNDSLSNKILYDWISNQSESFVISDTIVVARYRSGDSNQNPGWAMDYDSYYTIEDGLVIKSERKYKNKFYNINLYYEYDSNRRLTKIFFGESSRKKRLSQESFYDSNGNLIKFLNYDFNDGKIDTVHQIRYFYNEKHQVVKRKMFEYGFIYQTLLFEYNKKGLETKETYFNGKNKWDGSYETVYNEKDQEIAVYKLNRKGKRKRLLTTYEYEY